MYLQQHSDSSAAFECLLLTSVKSRGLLHYGSDEQRGQCLYPLLETDKMRGYRQLLLLLCYKLLYIVFIKSRAEIIEFQYM